VAETNSDPATNTNFPAGYAINGTITSATGVLSILIGFPFEVEAYLHTDKASLLAMDTILTKDIVVDTTPPTLSAGNVNRTSDTEATIGFTTDELGTAYYLALTSGAPVPTNAAVKAGGSSLGAVSAGVVSGKTITLTAGPKDIYVVVEDSSGNISAPLKIVDNSLHFTDGAAYDIPASTVGTAIANINAALGVSGGTVPYTFSATGLPEGISISADGIISGTPTAESPAGTAELTVTDSATPTAASRSITIAFAAVNPSFVTVTGITDVPVAAMAGSPLTLSGTVNPADATNKTIEWSLKDAGTTRAAVSGSTLNAYSAGVAIVTARIIDGQAIGNDYIQDFNIAVTVDADNNIAIDGEQISIGQDMSGEGWEWNAADKTLTLTGGDSGEIKIAMSDDVTVALSGDISAVSVNKSGTGDLTITGVPGSELTLNSVSVPAISAEGDIIIDSGTIYAFTLNSVAIESKNGSVIITGSARVSAESSGDAAIKSKVKIEILTSGNVNATATGGNYALEVETASGVITIMSGTTSLTVSAEDLAFNVVPDISGDNTLVYVNGKLIFGGPKGGSGGGGCSAGFGLLTLALVPWVVFGRKSSR
jgi:hypothetical protein